MQDLFLVLTAVAVLDGDWSLVEQKLVGQTDVQLISAVSGPLATPLRPFVANHTDDAIFVEIRINRIGAPYTLQLASGQNMLVNGEKMRRGINKPSDKLLFEFMIWGSQFNATLPMSLRPDSRRVIGHHLIYVLGAERYAQVLKEL